MKLNSKEKMKQHRLEEHYKYSQYQLLTETHKEKTPTNLPRGFLSPKNHIKELAFIQNLKGFKPKKMRSHNNSSINNSSNSIQIEKLLGTNNMRNIEKHKSFQKNNTDLELSEYLRTEQTQTSTANTTNIEALKGHKKNFKQKSYNKMMEMMKRNRFISCSIKSMDISKIKKSDTYLYTPSAKLLDQNNRKRDKSSFLQSSENTIDKDDLSTSNIMTYKDLVQINGVPELSLKALEKNYAEYPNSIEFTKQIGFIMGYGVNTYKGLFKKNNEDRVSIIQNVPKPKNYKGEWPCCSLMGVYDGHGGKTCANYLKDHLLNYIVKNDNFPNDPIQAIEKGFKKAETNFLNEKSLNSDNQLIDSSGSCAIVLVVINQMCYIANLGDSRALVSMNRGRKYQVLSTEHSVNNLEEKKRIVFNGGTIYQTKISLNQFIIKDDVNDDSFTGPTLYGPDRILPGKLTVSRSIGDPEAKWPQFGGKYDIIISKPSIMTYKISSKSDFIILGSDGIFEQMSNHEIIEAIWLIKKVNATNYGRCVDIIIKSALERNSLDNLTAILIDLNSIRSPTIINSLPEAQFETNNIYSTVEQRNNRRSVNKLISQVNTPTYTVNKRDKNKNYFG